MKEEQRDQLLAQEYFQLQKTIEDFDGRALTIKAWSVTFSAAGIGLAYDKGKPTILLVAALSALVFWIVETVWKIHQRAFYDRVERIEAYFAGAPDEIFPLQISRSWFASFGGPKRAIRWV